MDPERWSAIQIAFAELVELDPAERANRLAALGATDPSLRAAVESLLEADTEVDARLAVIEAPFLLPAPAITDPLGLVGRTISHFRVLEPLGAGGMGVVYRAEDTRLARIVALKFLLPQLSLDTSARLRFLREARAAAALDHVNLCTVHEVGESEDGRPFLAMPLYSGETLQARIRRVGPLPPGQALQIGRQIVQGLTCAHAAGIVHRDLKPGNVILLSDGTVKILDFGLAMVRDQSLTPSSLRLGTLLYMAPEQVQGLAVDGRTDLWALGVILYEMFTGQRPFVGDNELALAHAILHDEPVPPPAIADVILTLLEKDPQRRFADSSAVLDALPTSELTDRQAIRRSVVRTWIRARKALTLRRVLMVGAAAGVLGWLVTRQRPAPRSLAVMPCVSTSKDSAREYVSDGVSADLITGLSRTGGFDKIISSASAREYKNTAKTPTQIGTELGVSFLLFCRYGETRNQDRLELQLVNARDGSVRWADQYEREISAYRTALPPQVVSDVLVAVGLRVSELQRAQFGRQPMHDQLALNLTKEGWFFFNKYTREGIQRSIVLFRQALDRDTTLAEAYVGLGTAYSQLGIAHGDMDPREAFPLVRQAALRAVALDSASAGGHALLGIYEWSYGWDWSSAERELNRAIALDPAASSGPDNIAFVYAAMGRFEDAVRAGRRATEIDPAVPATWADAGVQYFAAGRYREAIPYIRHALEMDPNAPPYHWILGAVLVEMGELEEGAAELERTVELAGGGEYWQGYLGYARGLMGDTAAARAILHRLDVSWRARPTGAGAGATAMVHIGLGNRDEAFRWIDEAYRLRCGTLAFLATTPPGRRLTSDPRYDALLRRLNLRG